MRLFSLLFARLQFRHFPGVRVKSYPARVSFLPYILFRQVMFAVIDGKIQNEGRETK